MIKYYDCSDCKHAFTTQKNGIYETYCDIDYRRVIDIDNHLCIKWVPNKKQGEFRPQGLTADKNYIAKLCNDGIQKVDKF